MKVPIHQYIADGETIYFAVPVRHEGQLNVLAEHIIQSIELDSFRLLFIVFSDRLELLHLCDYTNIDMLPDAVSIRGEWQDGATLDPVIGVVLADHGAVRRRETPTLFLFSDGQVRTHWDHSTLAHLVKLVWLHEPSSAPLVTPFGDRHEISLSP